MINIKCIYEDGNEVITKFNGTLEEAKEYFIHRGKQFNVGKGSRDSLKKCEKVILV